MKWISVKEYYPTQSVKVLGWHKSRQTVLILTAYNSKYKGKADHWHYYDVDGSNRIEFRDNEITHWMPLPEPPKE